MAKIVQITVELCSLYMVVSLCLKSFKLAFSSTRTENFQMYKVGLEKAEEPEIKLQTSAGLSKNQESSRKTSISALLIHQTVENC